MSSEVVYDARLHGSRARQSPGLIGRCLQKDRVDRLADASTARLDRWQVSTGGGSSPLWDPNGKGIVYRQGQLIQHVAVTTSPVFAPGTPATLFAATLPVDGTGMSYAMAPDGSFIVVKPAAGTGGVTEYRVVLNWTEDLRARVRAGK